MSIVRPRILIDVDGVLADFLTPALKTMNDLLGTAVTLEDMKSWYLFDAFDFEVTRKERDICYEQWKTPGWCKSLSPYPGAQEGVKRLQEIADVYIVTSPMDGETWMYERQHWLTRHFGFTRSNIVHTDGKYIVSGDIFIDDKTEHCINWKACHPRGYAVRWKQHTNRLVPYEGITTDDWNYVYELAKQLSYEGDRTWKHRII